MKKLICLVMILFPGFSLAQDVPRLDLKGTYGMYRLSNNTFGQPADGDYERNAKFFGTGFSVRVDGRWRKIGTAIDCDAGTLAEYTTATGVPIPDHTHCVIYKQDGEPMQAAFFLSVDGSTIYHKIFGMQRGSRVWVLGERQ